MKSSVPVLLAVLLVMVADARMTVTDLLDSGCWVDAVNGTSQFMKYPTQQRFSFAMAFCQSNHARLVTSEVNFPAALRPWSAYRRTNPSIPTWYDATSGKPIAAFWQAVFSTSPILGNTNMADLCTVMFPASGMNDLTLSLVDCSSVQDVVCERDDPSLVPQWYLSPFPQGPAGPDPLVAFGMIRRMMNFSAANQSCRDQEAELASLPPFGNPIWADAILPALRSTSGMMWQVGQQVNPPSCQAAASSAPGFFTSYSPVAQAYVTMGPTAAYDAVMSTAARQLPVSCGTTGVASVSMVDIAAPLLSSLSCESISNVSAPFPVLCLRRLIQARFTFNIGSVGFYANMMNATGGVNLTVSIDPAPVVGPVVFAVFPTNASVGVPLAASVTFVPGGATSAEVPFAVLGPGSLSASVRGLDPSRTVPNGVGRGTTAVQVQNDLTWLSLGGAATTLRPGQTQPLRITSSIPATRLITIVPTTAWASNPCISVSAAFLYPSASSAMINVGRDASAACSYGPDRISFSVVPSTGVVWAGDVNYADVSLQPAISVMVMVSPSYIMEQAGSTATVTANVFMWAQTTGISISVLNVTDVCAPYLMVTSSVELEVGQYMAVFEMSTRTGKEYRVPDDMDCVVWFTTNDTAMDIYNHFVTVRLRKRQAFQTSFPSIISSTTLLNKTFAVSLPEFIGASGTIAVDVTLHPDCGSLPVTCLFDSTNRLCTGTVPTCATAEWIELRYNENISTPSALGTVLPWEQQDGIFPILRTVPWGSVPVWYSPRVRSNAPRPEAYIGVPYSFNISMTPVDFVSYSGSHAFAVVFNPTSALGHTKLCWSPALCQYDTVVPPMTIQKMYWQSAGFFTMDAPVAYTALDATPTSTWEVLVDSYRMDTFQRVTVAVATAGPTDMVRTLNTSSLTVYPGMPASVCFALNGSLVNGTVVITPSSLSAQCSTFTPSSLNWTYIPNEPYWRRGSHYPTQCFRIVWNGGCLPPPGWSGPSVLSFYQSSTDAAYQSIALAPIAATGGTMVTLTTVNITDTAQTTSTSIAKPGYTWRLLVNYTGAPPPSSLMLSITVQSPCCPGCIAPIIINTTATGWPITVAVPLTNATALCPPRVFATVTRHQQQQQGDTPLEGAATCMIQASPVSVLFLSPPILVVTNVNKTSVNEYSLLQIPSGVRLSAPQALSGGIGGVGTQLAVLRHQQINFTVKAVGGAVGAFPSLVLRDANGFTCASTTVGVSPSISVVTSCQWTLPLSPFSSVGAVGFPIWFPAVSALSDVSALGPLTNIDQAVVGHLFALPRILPAFTSLPVYPLIAQLPTPPINFTVSYLPSSLEGNGMTGIRFVEFNSRFQMLPTYQVPLPSGPQWTSTPPNATITSLFITPDIPVRDTLGATITISGDNWFPLDIISPVEAAVTTSMRPSSRVAASTTLAIIPAGAPYVLNYSVPPPAMYPYNASLSVSVAMSPSYCGALTMPNGGTSMTFSADESVAPLGVTIIPYCSFTLTCDTTIGASVLPPPAISFFVTGTVLSRLLLQCDSQDFVGYTDVVMCTAVGDGGVWAGAPSLAVQFSPDPGNPDRGATLLLNRSIPMPQGASPNVSFAVMATPQYATAGLWNESINGMVTLNGSSTGPSTVDALPLMLRAVPQITLTPTGNWSFDVVLTRLPKPGRILVLNFTSHNAAIQPSTLNIGGVGPLEWTLHVSPAGRTATVNMSAGIGNTAVEFLPSVNTTIKLSFSPSGTWSGTSTPTTLSSSETPSVSPTASNSITSTASSSSSTSLSGTVSESWSVSTSCTLSPTLSASWSHTTTMSHRRAVNERRTRSVTPTRSAVRAKTPTVKAPQIGGRTPSRHRDRVPTVSPTPELVPILGVLAPAVQTAVTTSVVSTAFSGGAISGAAVSRTLASISQAQRCIAIPATDRVTFPQSVMPPWRLGIDSDERPLLPYHRMAAVAGMAVLLMLMLLMAIAGAVMYFAFRKAPKLNWFAELALRAPGVITNSVVGLLLDGCVSGGAIALIYREAEYFISGIVAPLVLLVIVVVAVVRRPSMWYPRWLLDDTESVSARKSAEEVLHNTGIGRVFIFLNGAGSWDATSSVRGSGEDAVREHRVRHLLLTPFFGKHQERLDSGTCWTSGEPPPMSVMDALRPYYLAFDLLMSILISVCNGLTTPSMCISPTVVTAVLLTTIFAWLLALRPMVSLGRNVLAIGLALLSAINAWMLVAGAISKDPWTMDKAMQFAVALSYLNVFAVVVSIVSAIIRYIVLKRIKEMSGDSGDVAMFESLLTGEGLAKSGKDAPAAVGLPSGTMEESEMAVMMPTTAAPVVMRPAPEFKPVTVAVPVPAASQAKDLSIGADKSNPLTMRAAVAADLGLDIDLEEDLSVVMDEGTGGRFPLADVVFDRPQQTAATTGWTGWTAEDDDDEL